MTTMTIDALRRILTHCAGEDEEADLTGDFLDVPLEDLGYDSLALMETVARIKQEFEVSIPDERIFELKTARMVLAAVNDTGAGGS